MARYVEEFMSLKCAGDVLNAVHPIGNKIEKEITEAMAIIKNLRGFILSSPGPHRVVDLCSGNALVPVLAAFLFPNTITIAIDKKYRDRKWHLVKNFTYLETDIYENYVYDFIDENTIITAVHPCQNLAKRVISIYKNSKAKGLILMPCCEGNLTKKYPQYIQEKLSSYDLWAWELAEEAGGNIHADKHCLSPKNLIIEAKKRFLS